MRRVYLIRESGQPRDISQASAFGDVIVCLPKGTEQLSAGMALNRLRSTLRDFGEGDYILYAGGEWPVLVAVGIVLRELNVKHVDLLVWKKLMDRTGAYVPTRMAL